MTDNPNGSCTSAGSPALSIGEGRLTVALVTSHNRRQKTTACLTELDACVEIDHIVLADGASSDGTASSSIKFDKVHVIHGTVEDYWAGGMRRAWSYAAEHFPHADFLLVNDDISTTAKDISRFLKSAPDRDTTPYVMGASFRHSDEKPDVISYGGYNSRPLRPTAFARVTKLERIQQVRVLNANLMLVPFSARTLVAGLSSRYRHGFADFDYCFRMHRKAGAVLLAPGTFGWCEPNPSAGTYRDEALGARQRVALIRSPKGLPPLEWLHFCQQARGVLFPITVVAPFVRFALSLIRGDIRKRSEVWRRHREHQGRS